MSKVIVDIPGGFGNQLFGYAFGYALSRELGVEYQIHTPFQDNGITWELQLRYLNVEYDRNLTYLWTNRLIDRIILNKLRRRINIGIGTKIDKSRELGDIQEYVNSYSGDTIYYGNWENEKYFKKYRKELIRMITPKEERDNSVKCILDKIEEEKRPTVGLHIRRGDKASDDGRQYAEYCIKAINIMKERVGEDALFYVISDDVSWCKDNLPKGIAEFVYPEYTSNQPTLDDWLILKACKHHIMGDSTFCWWAAWLSEDTSQVVVCPPNKVVDNWISCEV